MRRVKIGIVGAGRVGAVLGAALQAAGHEIVAVAGESDASRQRAEKLLPGVLILKPTAVSRACDLLLLTVPDDMLGNVIEWTSTFFTVQLSQETIDPPGPKIAEYRSLRGGGWFDDPELVRASARAWFEDGDTDYNVGFRCVAR